MQHREPSLELSEDLDGKEGGDWGGLRWIYTHDYNRLELLYSRNHHRVVKEYSSNYTLNLKTENKYMK